MYVDSAGDVTFQAITHPLDRFDYYCGLRVSKGGKKRKKRPKTFDILECNK